MALLPYYIGALVLLGIVSVILMISGIGDYTLLTGAAAGTAVSALNFVLMAISAEKAITLTEKSAKLAMNGSYGARYIGTFIILGVLMFFKIINPVTAVLPLFVPKIAYTVTAFKEKAISDSKFTAADLTLNLYKDIKYSLRERPVKIREEH